MLIQKKQWRSGSKDTYALTTPGTIHMWEKNQLPFNKCCVPVWPKPTRINGIMELVSLNWEKKHLLWSCRFGGSAWFLLRKTWKLWVVGFPVWSLLAFSSVYNAHFVRLFVKFLCFSLPCLLPFLCLLMTVFHCLVQCLTQKKLSDIGWKYI